MSLFDKIQRWEKALHASFNDLPDTPEGNRKAAFYLTWLDHGFLRALWGNVAEIAPGVWRGNHPTAKRWKKLKAMGIKTVLNLRSRGGQPYYVSEARICDRLGLELITVSLSGRSAPEKYQLLELVKVFRTIDKPFFMHCKSGADRTGLASAIYLLVIEGRPLDEARRMLSFKYVHLKSTKAGILDAFLDEYGKTGGDFEEWVRNTYDRDRFQASFNAAYSARKGRK